MLATNANVPDLTLPPAVYVKQHIDATAIFLSARTIVSAFDRLSGQEREEFFRDYLTKFTEQVLALHVVDEQIERLACTACDDSGKASCRACGGIGGEQIVCRVCGGKGEVGCAECGENNEE